MQHRFLFVKKVKLKSKINSKIKENFTDSFKSLLTTYSLSKYCCEKKKI